MSSQERRQDNHSSLTRLPTIRACLFDLDGLLIDSEDILTLCLNEVLHEYNKPSIPWSIKAQLQGRTFNDAAQIFLDWAGIDCSVEKFYSKIGTLQAKHFSDTKPLPGALTLLALLSGARHPQVHLALATSSNTRNFLLKTQHLDHLVAYFPPDSRVLGDDGRIALGRGKPAPDIYLLALKTLNDAIKQEGKEAEIQTRECLVLEDSVSGVEAGRRAGMQVVWCPHQGLLEEYQGREREVLAGLTGAYKEGKSTEVGMNGYRAGGSPGNIDDGWGLLLRSLEDFPYNRYGINVFTQPGNL